MLITYSGIPIYSIGHCLVGSHLTHTQQTDRRFLGLYDVSDSGCVIKGHQNDVTKLMKTLSDARSDVIT